MDTRLPTFLRLVRVANWRIVPTIWHEQMRRALSDGLVTVGWGGVLELTDAGRQRIRRENPALTAGDSQ